MPSLDEAASSTWESLKGVVSPDWEVSKTKQRLAIREALELEKRSDADEFFGLDECEEARAAFEGIEGAVDHGP